MRLLLQCRRHHLLFLCCQPLKMLLR
jgi:hypothetical protein